jgi:ribonuclease HI
MAILLTREQVLEKYHAGPVTGVFTDGSAYPNPGPGGYGAVYAIDGEVWQERHGARDYTTNNEMELTAMLEGYKLIPDGVVTNIYSDSQYVVKTLTEWAPGWERRGWRRGTGPIQNLELVKELYAVSLTKPFVTPVWVRGHSGLRWNEYADCLSTLWRVPKE